MTVKVKLYDRADLEWCSGRMAHLRVRDGDGRTLCNADAYGHFRRRTITDAEAAEKHQCKSCLKRVKP